MALIDHEHQRLGRGGELREPLRRSVDHRNEHAVVAQVILSARSEQTDLATWRVGVLSDGVPPLPRKGLSRHYNCELDRGLTLARLLPSREGD